MPSIVKILRNFTIFCAILCKQGYLYEQRPIKAEFHDYFATIEAIQQPEDFYVTTNAVALIKGARGLSGELKLAQSSNPNSPVQVQLNVSNLPVGNYSLKIHNYGDTSDMCRNAGKQWRQLAVFQIAKTDGTSYMKSFKTYEISLRDEQNVVGRALSISNAKDGYDSTKTLSCEPIGITGETTYYSSGGQSVVIVHDILADYLRGLWAAQD